MKEWCVCVSVCVRESVCVWKRITCVSDWNRENERDGECVSERERDKKRDNVKNTMMKFFMQVKRNVPWVNESLNKSLFHICENFAEKTFGGI